MSDYQHLAANVLEGTEIIPLDPLRDGVEQISEILTEYDDISGLHIVSHGSPGNLHLGTAELNFNTIGNYTTALQKWGNALTDTADILIYGCDVAAGENGRTFVQQLSTLSDADIAASSDRTGSAALGGNWDFEFTRGVIETGLVFKSKLMETYDAVFQKPIRIEAEDMALSTYGVESAGVASNGNLISLKGRGKTGTASTAFTNPAGTYNLVVGYYDENDGVSQLSVKADGKQIDFLNLDQDLGSNYISTGNLVKHTIANVSLKEGSQIEIQGKRDGGEFARVDFIDFIPVSSDLKSPVNDDSLRAFPGPVNDDSVRAFPGAEGFGANAKGGRGGDVLFVDNLNDSGPGSLRAALEASGPRTVIFRTGGTIELKSGITITNPYLTIAGQTAPGDGIAIKLAENTPDTSPFLIATHDVVIRHLRIRSGVPYVPPSATNSGNNNSVIWGDNSYDVIIDHSSLSWAIDQNMVAQAGAKNITVQNSIISEGLMNSRHPMGPQSCGPLVAGGANRVTFYKNLMAHNGGRNPLFNLKNSKTIYAQIVNNIVYNWGHMGTEIEPAEAKGTIKANIVGNYYKPGYNSHNYEITVGGPGIAQMYVKGNIGPNRPNDSMNDWDMVGLFDYKTWERSQSAPTSYQVTTPHDMPVLPTVSAFDAYDDVLENAGATKPGWDAVDKRIINDVKNGTGRIIDDPSQVGGWPNLSKGKPPADKDKDGMPDVWEKQNGFNPNNANDRNGDADRDGYTNLEEYLNSIA